MQIDEALQRLNSAAGLAAGRGSLIFHLDLAIEAARAALSADGFATDALAATVDPSGYRVFALDAGASPRVLATVGFDAGGTAVVAAARVIAGPLVEAVARARQSIAADPRDSGARTHIPVVVPSRASSASLEGYAIAVDPSAGDLVLDGHWRMIVTPDGRRVTHRSPMSAGTSAGFADGLRLLAHAGATPNELYTYLSLKHDVPLLIDTAKSGLRWRVAGERTTLA